MKRFQSSSEEDRALPALSSSMESNRLQVRNQPAPLPTPLPPSPPGPAYGPHRQLRTPSPWRYSPYGRQRYSPMMMQQPQPQPQRQPQPQPQPQQSNFGSGGVHHQDNMIPNIQVFNNGDGEAESGHHPTKIYNYYLDPDHSWSITITAIPMGTIDPLVVPTRIPDEVILTDSHHPSNPVNNYVIVPTHDNLNPVDNHDNVGVSVIVPTYPVQDDADETKLDLSLHL